MEKNKKKSKKWLIVGGVLFLVLIVGGCFGFYYYKHEQKLKEIKLEEAKIAKERKQLENEIKAVYNTIVKTKNEAKVYKYEKDKYIESGLISEGLQLNLEQIEPTYKNEYLKISDFTKDFYINYKDIVKEEKDIEYDKRYLKYIPFNESVELNGLTEFYDKNNKLLYKLDIKGTYPIYVKDDNKYYIEFNNQLLYVKKEGVKVIQKKNTELGHTNKMSVITYHFFYDSRKGEACDDVICMDTIDFEKQLQYLIDQNFFTPKMEEFDWFIDEKVQLPEKSVLITIDDGWMAGPGLETLKKYKLNATIFLISGDYDKEWTSNEYVEAQSHTHKLHKQNLCPGYALQGSGLLCLDKNVLLEDFKKSREALDNPIALCYPFYEYNDYTKSVVKEAGFSLAFAGGNKKAVTKSDKYAVPRYTIVSTHTLDEFKEIVN